jgi:hypothetical protein
MDGVLNGYGYFTRPIFYLYKLFGKRYKVFGVHERKVKRLAKIVKKTNAKIVISSTWRGSIKKYLQHQYGMNMNGRLVSGLFNYDSNKNFEILIDKSRCHSYDDIVKLLNLFKKYDIQLLDFTKNGCGEKREDQIQELIDNFDEKIESFIVIDDDIGDLQKFVGKELIRTSYQRKFKTKTWTNTIDGIRRKHIKQAIKILKGGKRWI